ncbi:MAG: hypothetical protein F6J93_05255 [Oscillatoria sp. SIO1A7]|nr:hypothetical protein [Oscillatoria sp. SIO1A7]
MGTWGLGDLGTWEEFSLLVLPTPPTVPTLSHAQCPMPIWCSLADRQHF